MVSEHHDNLCYGTYVPDAFLAMDISALPTFLDFNFLEARISQNRQGTIFPTERVVLVLMPLLQALTNVRCNSRRQIQLSNQGILIEVVLGCYHSQQYGPLHCAPQDRILNRRETPYP